MDVGRLPEDVAVGVPAPSPTRAIGPRDVNSERPATRRGSFFRRGDGIRESSRRLIGLRVSRVTQRQQAALENMSFNPVSLELEPSAGGRPPEEMQIEEKKKFRRAVATAQC